MTKIPFEDLPSTNTPLSASNFNTMQDNIETAIDGTITNTYGTSQTIGYSQELVNKIGTTASGWGDLMAASNSSYAVHFYGSWVATKISTDGIWKFDIQGQLSMSNPPADYYTWGFSPSKISALLNTAIGVQVQYDSTILGRCQWTAYTTSGALRYDRVNYGTILGYESGYLIPARYYNTSGSIGGWGLNRFNSGEYFTATIYLREV